MIISHLPSDLQLFPIISNRSGDNEIRTHDPLLARQVLSQLSYTPRWAQVDSNHRPRAYQARALTG